MSPSPPTTVNQTSTTPMAARRQSLEKQLAQRPTAPELRARHILPETAAAPALQGAAHDLAKQMLADSLHEKLARRPDAEELVQKGILTEADRLYEERIEEEYAKREGGA
ncbi:Bgt-2134 [Blumeria graminis f. sp. tritici]|uniref:Bgt-2134 n=3 Tax=Blumeria graminis TaxID=34373 RepID=A0A061HJB9_BLUGR|nr:hypothetical protein BGT96224_2134 [Blumeria graminis f. sp. tritici 96224]VCU39880.1 Bgt-2134 [Blumeria graminis f. sp. tritici]